MHSSLTLTECWNNSSNQYTSAAFNCATKDTDPTPFFLTSLGRSIALEPHFQSSIACLSVIALTNAFSNPPSPTFVVHLDTAKIGPHPVQVSVSVQPAHLLPLTPLFCLALAGMERSGRSRRDGESAYTPVQAGAVAQQSHSKSSITLLARQYAGTI